MWHNTNIMNVEHYLFTRNISKNEDYSWRGDIQKSEMTADEEAAFQSAVLSNEGYCIIDGKISQVFEEKSYYRVIQFHNLQSDYEDYLISRAEGADETL
jgi:isocitrate dehydrogenase